MTIYKVIQVVGTSKKGFSEATSAALKRAAQTISDIRWFEVKEMRGRVEENKIAEYQVKVDIGFHLHDKDEAKPAAKGKK